MIGGFLKPVINSVRVEISDDEFTQIVTGNQTTDLALATSWWSRDIVARSYWCTADGVAGGRVTAQAYMQLSPAGSSWARGCWHGGFLEPFEGVVSHPSASAGVDQCYAGDA